MKERLRPADYRYLGVCLALLLGAIWYSADNFYRAFPEASIDFRVTRNDAQHLAQQFLLSQGFRLRGYRNASSFTYDDDGKTFLERELGLEKANQLMGTRVRLWRWSFRWFRPLQKEEFRVDFTSRGEFAGFNHEIAEDTALPEITTEQARNLAEDYLRTRAHLEPDALEFVETSSVTRPHRVDRTFTWKERDFNVHDATYRVSVTVLGDEVGGYNEFLKIPEQWTRDYERLRSKNNEAQTFDLMATLALLLAVVVVVVQSVRRQDIRWRQATIVGLVGMGLSFLSSLNEFPLSEFGYPTTDGYGSFVVQKLMQALLSALGWGGALFLIAAGAEVLYRKFLPDKVSVGNLFTFRGLRTKRFFLGAVLGVTLCAIFIAYQTVFYIVAYRLGAWSPADVPYSDLLNTRFPWLFVLIGGYLPAISEEFMFRMFAIPFLRRAVRWLPAAVVLAAFIWGFGHAGYAQQPFYIRGLEVGIGGVALGMVMLHWGILPTLVWHYSVDAMYSAMLLLRSHSLYFKFSGAASAGIFVLPILLSLVAYWRKGGFEPEDGLLNRDEPVATDLPVETTPVAAEAVTSYHRLTKSARFAAIAIFIAGLLTALIPNNTSFGESPGFKLTSDQSRTYADTFLRTQNVEPATYRQVTYPEARWGGNDSLAAKYFIEHAPIGTASRLFERYRPVQVWATRYFKSLEKEEFLVITQPETGEVVGYNRQIPEDRAGADLSTGDALGIASTFAAARGTDVLSMDLKESNSQKQKARRDYSLVWEARAGDSRNLDEAHYRVAIGVAGDTVSWMRTYWKLPETFQRNRSRENFISISALAIRIALTALGVVFGMWLLVGQIRQGTVPWKRSLLWSIPPTIAAAVVLALSLKISLYRGYPTSVAFDTYTVTAVLGLSIGVAFSYVMYCAAAALLLTFFPESAAAFRVPARRILGLDAAVLLLMAIGLWHVCHELSNILVTRFHALAILDVDGPTLTGLPAPVLAAVAGVARSVLSQAAVVALFALVLKHLRRRWMLVPLALLAACASVSEEVRSPGEFALEYAIGIAGIVCALAFCIWFARGNYLAYFAVLTLSAFHPALAELIHSPNPALVTQGWILAVVLILILVWTLGPGWTRSARSSGAKAEEAAAP